MTDQLILQEVDDDLILQGDGQPGPGGLPGPQGDTGPAGTITVGAVATGAPGTSVIVGNSGTDENAILAFTIPRGDPGADGTGIAIKGEVANFAALSGVHSPAVGDSYVTLDTGELYFWTGTGWNGPVQFRGPSGLNGWSPVYVPVQDGSRFVWKLADYILGQGDKPTTVPKYVDAGGNLVDAIGDGADILGPMRVTLQAYVDAAAAQVALATGQVTAGQALLDQNTDQTAQGLVAAGQAAGSAAAAHVDALNAGNISGAVLATDLPTVAWGIKSPYGPGITVYFDLNWNLHSPGWNRNIDPTTQKVEDVNRYTGQVWTGSDAQGPYVGDVRVKVGGDLSWGSPWNTVGLFTNPDGRRIFSGLAAGVVPPSKFTQDEIQRWSNDAWEATRDQQNRSPRFCHMRPDYANGLAHFGTSHSLESVGFPTHPDIITQPAWVSNYLWTYGYSSSQGNPLSPDPTFFQPIGPIGSSPPYSTANPRDYLQPHAVHSLSDNAPYTILSRADESALVNPGNVTNPSANQCPNGAFAFGAQLLKYFLDGTPKLGSNAAQPGLPQPGLQVGPFITGGMGSPGKPFEDFVPGGWGITSGQPADRHINYYGQYTSWATLNGVAVLDKFNAGQWTQSKFQIICNTFDPFRGNSNSGVIGGSTDGSVANLDPTWIRRAAVRWMDKASTDLNDILGQKERPLSLWTPPDGSYIKNQTGQQTGDGVNGLHDPQYGSMVLGGFYMGPDHGHWNYNGYISRDIYAAFVLYMAHLGISIHPVMPFGKPKQRGSQIAMPVYTDSALQIAPGYFGNDYYLLPDAGFFFRDSVTRAITSPVRVTIDTRAPNLNLILFDLPSAPANLQLVNYASDNNLTSPNHHGAGNICNTRQSTAWINFFDGQGQPNVDPEIATLVAPWQQGQPADMRGQMLPFSDLPCEWSYRSL